MRRSNFAPIILFALAAFSSVFAQDRRMHQVLNLVGDWKFEIGDNPRWADAGFNDSRWESIHVPSPWENEGYPGYDGYAWYRNHIRLDASLRGRVLYLQLGYVDDVAQVFVNGRMIGYIGSLPPDYASAFGTLAQFLLPPEFLRFDADNVIAVRIYDNYQQGGIVRGETGIYEPVNYLTPDLDLSGKWKFSTGDDKAWAESSFDDSRWKELIVPLTWDAQGYIDYDGIAWYRMKFRIPERLADQKLILLLGKIDDDDETYVNGHLVGRTGNMHRPLGRAHLNNDYIQPREYYVPASDLNADGENTVAVRVLDVWSHGGIYDGPIGLVQRDRYLQWKDKTKSVWDYFRTLIK